MIFSIRTLDAVKQKLQTLIATHEKNIKELPERWYHSDFEDGYTKGIKESEREFIRELKTFIKELDVQ